MSGSLAPTANGVDLLVGGYSLLFLTLACKLGSLGMDSLVDTKEGCQHTPANGGRDTILTHRARSRASLIINPRHLSISKRIAYLRFPINKYFLQLSGPLRERGID